MSARWAVLTARMGGRRVVSLAGYLLSGPFWIFGFVFNESVTYESWDNALRVFVIAAVGHLGLGAVFLLAHLTVLRNRAERPVSLWTAAAVWGLAGSTRAVVLVVGFTVTDIANGVPTQQRIVFSALMAIIGYALASYAFDAFDRFAVARAETLEVLLQGEDQLSAHRAAVQSMEEALVARVDKRLKKAQDATMDALDQLEESLASSSHALPKVEELRTLSDSTWRRISQDLWNSAPSRAPKIRLRELAQLYASSRPFSELYLVVVAFFLFILLYSRVFDPAVGAALVGIWLAGALTVGSLGNWLLPPLQKYTLPTFFVLVTLFLASSLPLLALADFWGAGTDETGRVVSVHALSVFVALLTSLPSTVSTARDRILSGLKASLDSTTLEKLHVESQLKVLSHKMASRLHGDIRGNFLAAILKLQDQIARGNTGAAVQEIHALRDILRESQGGVPMIENSRGDLEKFVTNWTALIDVALDQPLSTVPEHYIPTVHTIVVDAVNNAVRHGKADWIRIGFSSEPGALLVSVQNNGEPTQGGRSGLGTAHLDLYAPDKWSLVRNSQGMTQLLVRLEESAIPTGSVSR